MNDPVGDKEIDELLAAQPEIADGGFSRRVIERLDAPTKNIRPRTWIIVGTVALSWTACWLLVPLMSVQQTLGNLQPIEIVIATVAASCTVAGAAWRLVMEEAL